MQIPHANTRPLFHPTFGSRPEQIIGRDQEIEDFVSGLHAPIGSRERCTFFMGQRGMGKTTLLLELAERAANEGFVVARVTAYDGMPEDIVETIQRNGSAFVPPEKRRVQGVSAGALGFSFGLTFSEATQSQYGFRTKMTLLCDKLAEYGKGVLILVDEAQTSEAMRQVAITYQHLVGEEKNIAIGMAGLPLAVSGVLNDKVLTFLNRAHRVTLGPVSMEAVRAYYVHAFRQLGLSCADDFLGAAVEATRGFPYLMQLVGYYLVQYCSDGGSIDRKGLDHALKSARRDFEVNVFEPILAPLSDNDLRFLKAMAVDERVTKTSDLRMRLGADGSFVQPYRARLIEAGVVESPRRGELVFAVPLLAEYLRG